MHFLRIWTLVVRASSQRTILWSKKKRVIYNQFVCNAVMLQNVADQTRVLNSLQDEDKTFARDDLSFLSPYGTRHLKRFGKYRAEYQAEAQPDIHMTMMPGVSL